MTNKIDFLEHELDVNALIQGILTVSSIDPSLGSLSLKANYSTLRTVFLSNLFSLLKPKRLKKIYPFQNPTDFANNINMVDTLTFGTPKYNEDIFSSDNIALILTNTEKMGKGLATFLRDKIKNNSNKFFIALDESESNEVPRENLSEYLIFSINLDGTRHKDLKKVSINRKKIAEAKEKLAAVKVNKKIHPKNFRRPSGGIFRQNMRFLERFLLKNYDFLTLARRRRENFAVFSSFL